MPLKSGGGASSYHTCFFKKQGQKHPKAILLPLFHEPVRLQRCRLGRRSTTQIQHSLWTQGQSPDALRRRHPPGQPRYWRVASPGRCRCHQSAFFIVRLFNVLPFSIVIVVVNEVVKASSSVNPCKDDAAVVAVPLSSSASSMFSPSPLSSLSSTESLKHPPLSLSLFLSLRLLVEAGNLPFGPPKVYPDKEGDWHVSRILHSGWCHQGQDRLGRLSAAPITARVNNCDVWRVERDVCACSF